MNYTTLQADVADYLHRSDLATQIVKFIEKARLRIARDLRSLEQETTATLSSPTNGVFALPADFMELRKAASGGTPLRPVSLHEMQYWTSLTRGQVYAIYGRNFWCPGASTVDISYYRIEATLTTGSTEHPTMAAHPQIWQAASMIEAALFTADDSLLSTWSAVYDAEVNATNARAEAARHGSAPAVTNSDVYLTFGEAVN